MSDDRAKEQAMAQLKAIKELIRRLDAAQDAEDDTEAENIEQEIMEDPLEVSVRSGWYNPGERGALPDEFKILLCTGGPAVRIVGDLDEHAQPINARIEFQDWYTPWEHLREVSEAENLYLMDYCRLFYYGE